MSDYIEVQDPPEPEVQMHDSMQELVSLQKTYADSKAKLDDASMAMHLSDLGKIHSQVKIETERVRAEVTTAESLAREMALEIAIELRTKNPAPGVKVVKSNQVILDDEAEAIEWLADKHPDLLETKIKIGDFNKLMKALAKPPEFVTVKTVEYATVRLASDLASHYPDTTREGDSVNEDAPF